MSKLLKTRTIRVDASTANGQGRSLCDTAAKLPGVRKVEPLAKGRIRVHYDLKETRLRDIAIELRAANYTLPHGLLARWKRSWIDFMEENERNNMTASPRPCCSSPQGVVTTSRKK